MNVDTTANKLTIKRPTGELDTIMVTDPELQGNLATLKKGDKIRVTYDEAVRLAFGVPRRNDQPADRRAPRLHAGVQR